MKPTIQFNEQSRRERDGRELRIGSAFPKTDYSFQAASIANGESRCFSSCRPSFRAISQEYFENEARRSFASEAAYFGVIVMTAALPIVQNASALAHLLRSIGSW